MAYKLHVAYQNQGTEPGILMGLRTHNDVMPEGERAFIFASTSKALEDGDLPVKIRNLVKKGGQQSGK